MNIISNFFAAVFLSAIVVSPYLPAQDIEEKIRGIDGRIEKITISTDEGEYIFEGEDAAALFSWMKSSSNSFVWQSSDKDGKKKVVVIDSDGKRQSVEIFGNDDDELIVLSDDIDMDTDGTKKKIKVEMEDGNKKVTVTTNENGEEKTEVFQGEDADKYLEEMKEKHGGDMEFFIEKDDTGKVKKKKIIIEKESDEESD